MVEIARREFLQATTALGASLALGSYAAAQPVAEPGRLRFFTPEEATFVDGAIDRLIPGEPEWPGAREADVLQYIDGQLDGPYGRGERLYLKGPITQGLPGQGYQLGLTPAELYRMSLREITNELPRRNIDWTKASEADKDGFLKTLEQGDLSVDGFSSAIFFETLLANTIEGYFADPAYGGNKDMASWRMIGFPGAYAAYLGVYTQHGMRFNRAPIAMTGQRAGHPHQHGIAK